MEESRNNNYLIDSLLDFFVFYVPFTLLLVFLWNRLFYILFNHEISKFLRPYSFWAILVELLVQNNIEFFTFVSFRAITTMISFNFSTKLLNVVTIIILLLIFLCSVCSYVLYSSQYGKLAKYFFVNMLIKSK